MGIFVLTEHFELKYKTFTKHESCLKTLSTEDVRANVGNNKMMISKFMPFVLSV